MSNSIIAQIVEGYMVHDACLATVKKFAAGGYSGVLVSLVHSGDEFIKRAKKKGIDVTKWLIIDAGEHSSASNVLSIGSASALTELSLAITQAIESMPEKTAFVFEGVNVLSVYSSGATVQRFLQFLVNKLRAWKVPSVLITGKGDDMSAGFLAELADEVKRSV